MPKISSVVHIDPHIVEALSKVKIFSVNEFLKCDTEKLALIFPSSKEVINMKKRLCLLASAYCLNGVVVLNNCFKYNATIPTGIKCLDDLLNGGLETGSLTELYGPPGCGKTQFCFTIASNVSRKLKRKVIYIDCKRDFSVQRIESILKNSELSQEQIVLSMERIEVIFVKDIYELLATLFSLNESFASKGRGDCRLIIIDSIASVHLPFVGTRYSQGTSLLSQMEMIMKQLAKTYSIVILFTNLALTYGEEDRASQTKPALGRFWIHVPSYRILVANGVITLTKSTGSPSCSEQKFTISHKGVVSSILN